MKHSTFNIQRSTSNGQPRHVNDWLHEPDARELKRLLGRCEKLAWYGWASAAGFAIAFFYAVTR